MIQIISYPKKKWLHTSLLFIVLIAFTNDAFAAFSLAKNASPVPGKKISPLERCSAISRYETTNSTIPETNEKKKESAGSDYFGFVSLVTGIIGVILPQRAKTQITYSWLSNPGYTVNKQLIVIAVLLGITTIAFSVVSKLRGEHRSSQVLATIGGLLGFITILESLIVYNEAVH